MSVSSKKASRWQKNRERGVSPIIATILLVAITVVLAAVLYVLVSGLTSHGSSTPYTVDFTAPTTGGTGSGNAWFDQMTITPTPGVTTSMFGLSVSPPGGGTYSVQGVAGTGCTVPASGAWKAWATGASGCNGPSAAGWYGVLVASNNSIAAIYATTGWQYAGGVTTIAVTSSYTLFVVSYNMVNGAGYNLNVFSTGASSVSGGGAL